MSFFFLFDLFKTPVFLTFERNTKTSTTLGLFCSIGLIIFLTISFSESDVFYKAFPKVVTFDIINEKRPFLNFQNEVFKVSIDNDEGKASIDPHIFQIHITNFFMELDSTGGGFKYVKNVTKTMHPCTEADFTDTLSKETSFENNFCLENPSFELEGYWNEKIVNFLRIDLLMCENKTSKGQCKSLEEIQEFFGTKYFNVYFTSHNTDTSNYLDPMTPIVLQEYTRIDLT